MSTAIAPRERLRAVFFGASRELVGSYDRAVNEQTFQIRVMAGRRDDPLSHAFLAPAPSRAMDCQYGQSTTQPR